MLDFDKILEEGSFTYRDVLIFMVDEGLAAKVVQELQLDGVLPEMTKEDTKDFDEFLIKNLMGLWER